MWVEKGEMSARWVHVAEGGAFLTYGRLKLHAALESSLHKQRLVYRHVPFAAATLVRLYRDVQSKGPVSDRLNR